MSADAAIPGSFRGLSLFSGLPGEVLQVFYISAEERLVRPGDLVVREGDPGEELFIIGRGRVGVVVGLQTPQETRIAELGPGDFFGEMCVIEPTVRSASVVADSVTFLYGLRSTTLNKVYQIWPQAQATIMANFARTLAERAFKLEPQFRDRAY